MVINLFSIKEWNFEDSEIFIKAFLKFNRWDVLHFSICDNHLENHFNSSKQLMRNKLKIINDRILRNVSKKNEDYIIL